MFQRPELPDIECEILIIGAGITGITAAKKLKELGRDVFILGSPYESQLAKSVNPENVDPNLTGLDIMKNMSAEMQSMGIKTKSSLVKNIEINENKILVKTSNQKFFPKVVLIATGAKQAKLNFEGEEKLFHNGISDCAICDFPLYKNRIVGVIGNHKYTAEAAELLNKNTLGVHLFWYNSTEKPKIDDKIKFYPGVTEIEAYGEEFIEGVKIKYQNGEQDIKLEGLFVEGKPVPATQFIDSNILTLNKDGYLVIDDNYQTKVKNIFAAGDVTGRTNTYEGAKEAGEQVSLVIDKFISS